MLMRGGSSKGAYFIAGDLPEDVRLRDQLLLRIMGTPDPRQIDGIGGAHPLTSKVAVVGPSAREGIDVEFLFLQLGVDQPIVTNRQYCGNILAGVGPFALERGLVEAGGEEARVSIHMLNFDSIAVATFPLDRGRPSYVGDTSVSGVPGTGAAVRLDFEGIVGSTTGDLLPTGSRVDVIDGVDCTLIDNGMPVVVMRASDLGVTGYETCAELEANGPLRERLESLRLEAGRLMNLGDVGRATVPKLTLVAPPLNNGNLSTRTFIPHRCHSSIGVFAAVSVATAALLPGSPASDLAVPTADGSFVLEHPTGSLQTIVRIRQDSDGRLTVESAGTVRTARKLMDGRVFPRSYP